MRSLSVHTPAAPIKYLPTSNGRHPDVWQKLLLKDTDIYCLFFLGAFGRFLCWKGFTVFNRIAYSVYLTQFPIFFYNIGTTRAASSYSPHLLVSVLR